eukprot:823022-Prymnesium_polylepis.1
MEPAMLLLLCLASAKGNMSTLGDMDFQSADAVSTETSTSHVDCIFIGMIGEDHMDIGHAFPFGRCKKKKTGKKQKSIMNTLLAPESDEDDADEI